MMPGMARKAKKSGKAGRGRPPVAAPTPARPHGGSPPKGQPPAPDTQTPGAQGQTAPAPGTTTPPTPVPTPPIPPPPTPREASPRSAESGLTPAEELSLYRQAANGDYPVSTTQRALAVKFTAENITSPDPKYSIAAVKNLIAMDCRNDRLRVAADIEKVRAEIEAMRQRAAVQGVQL